MIDHEDLAPAVVPRGSRGRGLARLGLDILAHDLRGTLLVLSLISTGLAVLFAAIAAAEVLRGRAGELVPVVFFAVVTLPLGAGWWGARSWDRARRARPGSILGRQPGRRPPGATTGL